MFKSDARLRRYCANGRKIKSACGIAAGAFVNQGQKGISFNGEAYLQPQPLPNILHRPPFLHTQ